MVFNSLAFCLFLPLVFALYWKFPIRWRNALLLTASYVFYGWWDFRFLGLILISSLTDFWVARTLDRTASPRQRKGLLGISLFVNLGILFFFKYFNFFLDSLSRLGLPTDDLSLSIILPVGISFYTFQTLSYTIDVYKRQFRAHQDWLSFFAFVAFFPQLVAGPIERAAHLLPQFNRFPDFDRAQAVRGCRLILWGFFKKVVIADNLAYYVDNLFAAPEAYGGAGAWLATLFFALQIYCDFSGYSDIAIGTARLFGFELRLNFRTPYFARSLTDFWRRWHISLSTWFRDYLYFPLGGNRVSSQGWVFNIMVTFVVSGLWHGANYTFLVWGGLHGLALVLERMIHWKPPRGIAHILTLTVVLIAWLFFRADTVQVAWQMMVQAFTPTGFWTEDVSFLHASVRDVYIIFSLVLFGILEYASRRNNFDHWLGQFSTPIRWAVYYLLIGWILLFGVFENTPTFIYFQF